MPDIREVLLQFSLSPTAVNVYLALLELGKANVDVLAQHSHTYKANAYDALSRLQEAGLANIVVEGKKKFFTATAPNQLTQLLEKKRSEELQKLDAFQKSLQEILPSLQAKYAATGEKEQCSILHGSVAYRNALAAACASSARGFWLGRCSVADVKQKNIKTKLLPRGLVLPLSFGVVGDAVFVELSKELVVHLQSKKVADEYRSVFAKL